LSWLLKCGLDLGRQHPKGTRLSGQALPKTEALASELDDVAAMGQPVDQGTTQQWVTDQLAPAVEGQVGRDQQAAAQVTLATATNKTRYCIILTYNVFRSLPLIILSMVNL
jgi:hypothetical protein